MRNIQRAAIALVCGGALVIPAIAQGVVGKIYWTTRTQIQRANLDGSDYEVVVPGGLATASGIDIDLGAQKVYWANLSGHTIQRANLDGSDIETLPIYTLGGYTVRLDTVAGKLYWDDRGDRIYRSNLAGGEPETLFIAGVPCWGLDVDASAQKIYWATGYNGRIYRANLDGSQRELLAQNTWGIPRVRLDVAGGKMYWTSLGRVYRANLDGTGSETIVSGQRSCIGIDLDIAAGKMYWTDNDLATISRANLDGTNVETLVHLDDSIFDPNPLDIRVIPAPEPGSVTVCLIALTALRSGVRSSR